MTHAADATKEKIVELLGAGISQSQVASACGVEESYISQLMEDEQFRELIQEKRAGKAVADKQIDDTIERIEKNALDKIERLLPFETNLMKVLKVFQAANAAKKKAESALQPQTNAGAVVNILMPQQALIQFKLTADSQVVEVGARALTTMPAAQIHAKLREKKAERLVVDATPAISERMAKRLAEF